LDDNAQFDELTMDYLAHLYALQPVMASAMGVHDYDSELPQLSPYSITEQLAAARSYLHDIDRISYTHLDGERRIDYRLARADTQIHIAQIEQGFQYEQKPSVYLDIAFYGLYLIVSRHNDGRPEDNWSLLSRMAAIPGLLQNARLNLKSPPAVFCNVALSMIEGCQQFIQYAVKRWLYAYGDDTEKAAFDELLPKVLQALDDYGEYIRVSILPHAAVDYAMDREWYEYNIRIAYMLSQSSEELIAIAEEEIQTALQELNDTAKSLSSDESWQSQIFKYSAAHQPASSLLSIYEDEIKRAQQFLRQRRVIDLPEDEIIVQATPDFLRGYFPSSAYIPLPQFDEKGIGIFWVTDAAPQSAKMAVAPFSIQHIRFAAIHETYPGHHLQSSLARKNPDRFRQHFANNPFFYEGWASYAEMWMMEMGYFPEPWTSMLQSEKKMRRAFRMLTDLKIHLRLWTLEDAIQFAKDTFGMAEEICRTELRFTLLNPGQNICATLGQRQLTQLRSRMERKLGAYYDSRRFHSQLLSYGSIPVRLIEDHMLRTLRRK
jgi:uncharacterized protein (DUF885 family)